MAIADGTGVAYSGDFYDHVLRNHFLPEVADGLNHDYVLLERMSNLKDKSMVQGKFIQHPIHTGRNVTGLGAVGIGGKLPTPGNQQYDEYQYPIRSFYGRIKFTGLVADSSSSDIDSWLRAVDSEMTGIRDDLARQENRMLFNDGSGILGLITDADGASSATQTVSFWTGIEGSGSFDTAAKDTTHFLEVGMRVAIINDSGGPSPTIEGIRTVQSKTATQVVFDSLIDLTASTNWYIVLCNDGTTTSLVDTGFQREPMGLGGIMSDADLTESYHESLVGFQNVEVANGGDWNSATVLANSGVRRPLTESLIQKGLSEVEKKLMGRTSAFICSYGVRDAFADLLLTYRRHVNKTELKAGFSTVAYNDIAMIPDRDMWPNVLWGIDEGDVRQHCMGASDYRFIDEDGSIYHRLPDEHAFQAAMYRRWTHGVMARGRQLVITDLDE